MAILTIYFGEYICSAKLFMDLISDGVLSCVIFWYVGVIKIQSIPYIAFSVFYYCSRSHICSFCNSRCFFNYCREISALSSFMFCFDYVAVCLSDNICDTFSK